MAASKNFADEWLKRQSSRAGFGNCHAHMARGVFPQVFPATAAHEAGRTPEGNPKKWENPEISTGAGPPRRRLKKAARPVIYISTSCLRMHLRLLRTCHAGTHLSRSSSQHHS